MKLSPSFTTKVVLLGSFLVLFCAIVPKVQGDRDLENFLVENLSPLEDGVDKANIAGGMTPFIIGGENASSGSYPWYSMLLQQVNENLYFYCGATLISQTYLLTAAHCINDDIVYGGAWVGALSNVQGSNNLNQYSELIRIDKSIRHPNYVDGNLDHDYALIKLKLSSSIKPAKLDTTSASTSYKTGKKLTALGFGCIDPTDKKWELELREVELLYRDYDDCTKYPPSLYPKSSITDNMMCATDDNKSLCNGDSGSALYDEENDMVTGIASFGRLDPFNPTVFPSVFARVSAQFESWIQPTVCDGMSDFDLGKPLLCITTTPPPTQYPTAYLTLSPSSSPSHRPSAKPVAKPTISPVANPKPSPPSSGGGTKTHQPTICKMEYKLALLTDIYGAETSWEIVSFQTGELVASSHAGGYSNSVSILESGCLPLNCYMFTIKDSFGDGLCCDHGDGSYFLFVNDNLIVNGGNFKKRETTLFGTCRPVEY
eukprot:CAMPEP_0203682980 /NCGR_PEP_ID=MMETSP0090-20130426/47282_1 /ASSEMBLY_ACC=CAM_ASM_001088 /TAXON_ID=426623 /ORGANISM="Chaetoceros affinis, Strain CCMP159" /LENGTH=485 /DNA_ID=CAMNT_0050552101 /DNA_START=27 /DNA_END=1484 /DNA_ORIENTATION=+